ncbi:hypothetical protein ACWKWW_21915 [Chryseobacterium cucumeris]
MKNFKKISRTKLQLVSGGKLVNGGIGCYCDGVYQGDYSSVQICMNVCNSHPWYQD